MKKCFLTHTEIYLYLARSTVPMSFQDLGVGRKMSMLGASLCNSGFFKAKILLIVFLEVLILLALLIYIGHYPFGAMGMWLHK